VASLHEGFVPFGINEEFKRVRELIDAVHPYNRGGNAGEHRSARQLGWQKPARWFSDITSSSLGSVLGNSKPLFWRRQLARARDRNNGVNELTHFPQRDEQDDTFTNADCYASSRESRESINVETSSEEDQFDLLMRFRCASQAWISESTRALEDRGGD